MATIIKDYSPNLYNYTMETENIKLASEGYNAEKLLLIPLINDDDSVSRHSSRLREIDRQIEKLLSTPPPP